MRTKYQGNEHVRRAQLQQLRRGFEVLEMKETNLEDELLLMAHVDLKGSKLEDVWFLDSGCNSHMTGTNKWFVKIDEDFQHSETGLEC